MTAGTENYCKKCGHIGATFIPTPELIHEGRLVCADCGAFIRWQGKYKNEGLARWMTKDEEKGYILQFGKYSGCPLNDIASTHPEYIRWLLLKTDFEEKSPEFHELLLGVAEEYDIDVSEER